MFRFFNQEQDRANQTADDRKIDELMNEVGNELGIDRDSREKLSSEKARELGQRMKEEIKKRT
ncbi:hypothetical protein [Desmospora profundinema]|uniref:Uncharacterized protein n=1 Tax=Desmospora profundinema TaxID=1571184 RepID=A0ABU1IJG0_9BACL|nr:hypothetical protein [Desmospora profundinema]MDR6224888.1 hypothetical protein [Desmospora profundinema]